MTQLQKIRLKSARDAIKDLDERARRGGVLLSKTFRQDLDRVRALTVAAGFAMRTIEHDDAHVYVMPYSSVSLHFPLRDVSKHMDVISEALYLWWRFLDDHILEKTESDVVGLLMRTQAGQNPAEWGKWMTQSQMKRLLKFKDHRLQWLKEHGHNIDKHPTKPLKSRYRLSALPPELRRDFC